MTSIKALLIKFVMITAVLWIVLGLFGVSFGDILIASVLLTGVSFIAGDLFVLPRFGNATATVADFGLAFIMLWLLGTYLFGWTGGVGTASFISAVIITMGEYFFHRYMENQVLDDVLAPENTQFNQNTMQTEFGSEIDIKRDEKRFKEDGKSSLGQEKDDYYNH